MAKELQLLLSLFAFLASAVQISPSSAMTDQLDMYALQDLYSSFNYPSQLSGWKPSGGDPCGEYWMGVICSGTAVVFIKIHGLGLGGFLGTQLYNLVSLKELDVSFNNIGGEISAFFPPNATDINLAYNHFTQNIPQSLVSLKHLLNLNLSHNSLSGPVANIFTDLPSLKKLDLSYNSFTGYIPSSFSTLTNLTTLFLQNNQFIGSVNFFDNLLLYELNIQNNHFSGDIPTQFEMIPNLWIEGNLFETGNHPLPNVPPDNMATNQNIPHAPATDSSAIASYPPFKVPKHDKKRLGLGAIVLTIGGGIFVAASTVLLVIKIYRPCTQRRSEVEKIYNSVAALPVSKATRAPTTDQQSMNMPFVHHDRSEMIVKRSLIRKSKVPGTAKQYSIADLQVATNSFNEDHRLGEGSLGSVFKAEFSGGRTLAVKTLNMVTISPYEEEQFLDVIRKISCLRHPNIACLLGYCMGHGQHILVYEYCGNISLDDALHSAQNTNKPLSWVARMSHAVSIARALKYLHWTCSPPVAHGNLKAANILFDDEGIPRLCDCGLAVLRPFIGVKVQASELPIGWTGYSAPEHGVPGIDKTKCDIYSFGVLLLELLTGRTPFDRSRPGEEKSLVRWASSHLHHLDFLEEMVDPTLKGTYSTKALSQLADVIYLCIQPDPELRPPMAEILESLVPLIRRMRVPKPKLSEILKSPASVKSQQILKSAHCVKSPASVKSQQILKSAHCVKSPDILRPPDVSEMSFRTAHSEFGPSPPFSPPPPLLMSTNDSQ